jgi:hypothetical protein
MAVFRIALTENERPVVNAERDCHPAAHVRRKMLVVWLLLQTRGLRCWSSAFRQLGTEDCLKVELQPAAVGAPHSGGWGPKTV